MNGRLTDLVSFQSQPQLGFRPRNLVAPLVRMDVAIRPTRPDNDFQELTTGFTGYYCVVCGTGSMEREVTKWRREPRIDPLQLLKCLSVLLSPTGGIKSKDEVQRLASLMTKFSKKLVSKCIYIQILKTTKTDLLGMFMAAGGWNLTHTWLSDAIVAKNWPLIQELLELLLMCPVDVERLKANNCPKLIKGLSRDSPNESVKLLASKLVEQWLKIVKGETEAVKAQNAIQEQARHADTTAKAESETYSEIVKVKDEPKPEVELPAPVKHENVAAMVKLENMDPKVELQKLVLKTDESSLADAPGTQLPVYKITMKDGKGVLAKVSAVEKSPLKESSVGVSDAEEAVAKPKVSDQLPSPPPPPPVKKEDSKKEAEDVKVNAEVKPKIKSELVDSTTKTNKDVSKKSKDGSSKSDRDKKSSSKEKSRDKDKERSREKSKDRDSKAAKDKKSGGNGISEKDKATLAKLIPPAISKLGKIPKKPRTEESVKASQSPTSDSKKPAPSDTRKPVPPPEPPVSKKPSISIETRKLGDPANRPKTVKTFNSKFRSTGLEEEAKPPPSRAVKKPGPPALEKKPFPPPPLKLPSLKRPSPPKETPVPEKKPKPSLPELTADDAKKEKSGGIKLIAPRPKRKFIRLWCEYNLSPMAMKQTDVRGCFFPRIVDDEILTHENETILLLHQYSKGELTREWTAAQVAGNEATSLTLDRYGSDQAIERNSEDGSTTNKAEMSFQFIHSMSLFEKNTTTSTVSGVPDEVWLLIHMTRLKLILKEPPTRQQCTHVSNLLETGKLHETGCKLNEEWNNVFPSGERHVHGRSDGFDEKGASQEKAPNQQQQRRSRNKERVASVCKGRREHTPLFTSEQRRDQVASRRQTSAQAPSPTEGELEENGSSKETEEQKRRLSKEDSPVENEITSDDTKENGPEEAPGKYPRGVLIYHKLRKGPKKSVRWKAEKDLETIKYFELDETERVNVTKTFTDMKQMERSNEREAFLLARKLRKCLLVKCCLVCIIVLICAASNELSFFLIAAQDDIMEEKTTWQPLIPLDLPPSLVESGARSREKDVQYAREKVILQALYFNRNMIPDSAAEPDLEIHPTTDPTIIPLDDVTGNPDSVNDFQNTPWPDPKPIIIPQSPPPQFQQPQPPFAQFPQNQGFQGVAPQMFPPNQGGLPNNMPVPMNNIVPSGGGDWRTGDGKVVPVNEMPPMPMDMYGPGGPPMGMGMPGMGAGPPGPDMSFGMMPGDDLGPPGGPFPPHQGFPNMGGGPPPPAMFPYQGGNGRGGRDMRRGRGGGGGPRGNGPWFQSNGPHMGGNWQGGRGGGGRGGRGSWGGQNRSVCKHFRGGYCRMAEKCPYLHPGVNGPSY
ncbi:hypothetical protein C0J52_02645 [Blattella germanica]|nr:hypothetical protein C0J52_02645 [Blattella germanica]